MLLYLITVLKKVVFKTFLESSSGFNKLFLTDELSVQPEIFEQLSKAFVELETNRILLGKMSRMKSIRTRIELTGNRWEITNEILNGLFVTRVWTASYPSYTQSSIYLNALR